MADPVAPCVDNDAREIRLREINALVARHYCGLDIRLLPDLI